MLGILWLVTQIFENECEPWVPHLRADVVESRRTNVPTISALRSMKSVAVLAAIGLIATACSSGGASQPPASQAPASAGASEAPSPAASAAVKDFAIIQAVVAPYYASWPQAAADANADFGVNVEVGSPQKFDQVEQDAIINSFIAKGDNRNRHPAGRRGRRRRDRQARRRLRCGRRGRRAPATNSRAPAR